MNIEKEPQNSQEDKEKEQEDGLMEKIGRQKKAAAFGGAIVAGVGAMEQSAHADQETDTHEEYYQQELEAAKQWQRMDPQKLMEAERFVEKLLRYYKESKDNTQVEDDIARREYHKSVVEVVKVNIHNLAESIGNKKENSSPLERIRAYSMVIDNIPEEDQELSYLKERLQSELYQLESNTPFYLKNVKEEETGAETESNTQQQNTQKENKRKGGDVTESNQYMNLDNF